MHIYDNRFPVAFESQRRPEALVADYQKVKQRLCLTRTVVVTPTCYGTDNSCTLSALAALGPSARGVALIDTNTSADELKRLHAAGFRGMRFNPIRNTIVVASMLEPLARRIAEYGWHIQMNIRGHDIPASEALIRSLPTPIVLDHIGRVRQPWKDYKEDLDPILRIMESGKVWLKLSGPYLDTKIGPPQFPDVSEIAEELIRRFPERLLWGSDWPHSTAKWPVNDDELLELFAAWVPDQVMRERILVENPAAIYNF
jgi:predicted TIM-barrel fold metal-dependent hydrolase